jgi:hypothetical protein
MTAPDRIYTAGDYPRDKQYLTEPISMWQVEYIRWDKVYLALEQLKSIQAHLQAYAPDNVVLRDKVLAAIKEIEQ